MMRKILIAFLLCFVYFPVFGLDFNALYSLKGLGSKDIEKTLQDVFPNDKAKQTGIAESMLRYWDKTNGEITFIELLNVCIENRITFCAENPKNPHCKGLHENASVGYDTCMRFIDTLYKNSKNRIRYQRKNGYRGEKMTKQKCIEIGGKWEYSEVYNSSYCSGKDGYSIVFSSACSEDGNGGTCIRLFSNIQVPLLTGVGLVELWGRYTNGYNFTCDTEFDNRTQHAVDAAGQDYLLCTAQGAPFEFEFDDLSEPEDQTIRDDTIRALCSIIGLQYFEPYLTAPGGCIATNPISDCSRLSEYANSFGFKVEKNESQQRCYLSKARLNELRTAYGIDNRVFESEIQTKLDYALKKRLETYVRNHLNNQNIKLESFSCDYSYKTSPTHWNDEVLTCYVNSHPVDFVFDDLSEAFGYERNASDAQFDCAIAGGKIAGRLCRGISQTQCEELNSTIVGGTEWDPKARACKLQNVNKAQKVNSILSITGGVALVIVALPISGAAGMVFVVASVAADVAIEAAFLGLERLHELHPSHVALEFTREAYKCNDKACAHEILSKYFGDINRIADDLTEGDFDIVAKHIDRLSELIPEDEFKYVITNSNVSVETKALNASTAALFLAAVFASPEQAMNKFVTKTPGFAKRIQHLIDMRELISNGWKKIGRFNFEEVTAGGITYYQYMYDDLDIAQKFLYQLRRDNCINNGAIIERNGQYAIVAFDTPNDLARFMDDIEDLSYAAVSDEVLALQQELDMGSIIKKLGLDTNQEPKFNEMANLYIEQQKLKQRIALETVNMKKHNFSDARIQGMLQEDYKRLNGVEKYLKELQDANPELAKRFNENKSDIDKIANAVVSSDEVLATKKTYMTNVLNGAIDEEKLKTAVITFKNNIIRNFPQDLYDQATNWSKLSPKDREFVIVQTQQYLSSVHGSNNVKGILFKSASEIGGNASFGNNTLRVSHDAALKNDNFNSVFTSLVHENIHAMQAAGNSPVSHLDELSDKNYVEAMVDISANRASPVEAEAYLTSGLFDNFLEEVRYAKGWQ